MCVLVFVLVDVCTWKKDKILSDCGLHYTQSSVRGLFLVGGTPEVSISQHVVAVAVEIPRACIRMNVRIEYQTVHNGYDRDEWTYAMYATCVYCV